MQVRKKVYENDTYVSTIMRRLDEGDNFQILMRYMLSLHRAAEFPRIASIFKKV